MFLRCAVLVAVVAGAYAGPIGWDSETNTECATSCPYESKFDWQPGKTYEYAYSGDVNTLMKGASEEHSSLHLTTTLKLEVLTRCEIVLKLTNIDLQDSNPSNYDDRSSVPLIDDFRGSLERNIARFGFKDGEIESVCSEDEPWVLNIKRAFLSHLQNTMTELDRTTRVTEIDISGKCPILYKPLGSGRIKKIKDVIGCVGGHSYETIFKGVPYDSASRIQSLPIMLSSSECEQTVNSDNIISQVSCLESHTFRPFSKEESGATTLIASNLRLVRVIDGTTESQQPIKNRASLEFDNTPTTHQMNVAVRETGQILREMCQVMTDDVRPEVPALFGKLVKKMRHLDSTNLINLHGQAKRMCDKAIKFFRDAVPMLHSTASLSLIKELIDSNDISDTEAEIWLTSLSLIPRPSLELLREAKPLITTRGPIARKATLAVSTLVSSFCDINECDKSREIQEIIRDFEERLNYNCNGDHDNALMALKAIGNAGNAVKVERIVPILGRCANNAEIAMEVRVAAITAHRRIPCTADHTELKNIYMSMALDSELRINAFLQLMKCPTQDIISQVGHTLENEEINQVGSFVWTYLTNLVESSDPHKLDISKILADKELKKTFNMDARKFSRNIEWSVFSHLLNTGATVESNVIMSEKSFVPRSASLNFTVDMFGKAINLFEVDGRVENFDKLLEDLFGPKKEINDIVDGQQRSKRSLLFNENSLNAYDDQYNVRPDGGPQASYSIKVFGNEIRYDDFHALNFDSLKEQLNFLDWLINLAQNHDFEVTKSLMFLDAAMVIPTYTGMPLKLSAEGTTTINVKVNGKMDIRRMMTWPSNIDIDGSIIPSGAVEIISEMGVDGHCAQTGLQMVSSLHSSSVVKGKIQLHDGKIFSMNLDMPKDKVEVINVESKFLIKHREESREQHMLTDNMLTYNDCMDLTKALGVEVCGEASIPLSRKLDAPLFPFTGPIKASIVINKKDTHTGYMMEAKFVQEKIRGKVKSDLIRFSVNTPESRIDREITTQLSLDRAAKSLGYILKTPWKTVKFDGSVTNTEENKGFSAVATVDQNKVYSFKFELPINNQNNDLEYNPSIEVVMPGIDPLKINGRFFYSPQKKVEYELRLRNVFTQPARMTGSITIQNGQRQRYEIQKKIISPFLNSELTANVIYNSGQVISNRIQLEYSFSDKKKESVVINNKLRNQSTRTISQYNFESQWTTTLYPHYDGNLHFDYSYGRNTLSMNLDTGFDKKSRVKITQSGNFNFNGAQKKVDGFLKMELPKNKNYELTVKHNHNNLKLNSMVGLKYGPKEANFDATLNREAGKLLKLSGEVKITYPGREITITESLEEKSRKEYHHDMELQYAQGKKIISNSVLKIKPLMELTSDLEIPSLEPMKFYGHLQPSLRNWQSKAEVTYGANKYGIDGNWNHGGNINAFTSRGNVEIEYPGRHIKTTAGLNRRDAVINGNMETQWDADNDPTQQISITTKTNIAVEKPSIYLKADYYPQQNLEFEANLKYEPENWMRSDSDLEGNLSLKSTYEGYENLKFAFKYDHSDSTVTGHAEASYDDKKFTSDLTMRKNDDYTDTGMTITIETPFSTYRKMGMSADYTLRNRAIESSVKVHWDDNEIALVANGEFNWRRHMADGTITFTSPYNEPIIIKATHNDNGKIFNTNLEATWANDKKMKLEQELTLDPGKKLIGIIKFTSPFKRYEEITLNSKTELNSKTFKIDHELKWAPRKLIVLDGSLTLEGIAWDGKLRLTTPFRTFDRLMINTSNKKSGAIWESHADIEYTGIEKVELDTQVGIHSVKKVAFIFKCPPGDAGTTEFNAVFDGTPRKFTTAIEAFNNKYMTEKFSLKAELDALDMRNSKAAINYKSPVGLKFITLQWGVKKNGRTYTTDASLEYPSYRGTINSVVTILHKFNFNTNTNIEYKPGQKIELVIKLKNKPKIEGLFSLKSPFHEPINFKVEHEGTLQKFDSGAELTYGDGKKITGDVNFSYGQKIEGSATFTSPFRRWENLQLKFGHEGTSRGIESSAEFSWNPISKITGNLDFSVNKRETSGSLLFTTPFENLSNVKAEFTHNGILTDFNNNGVFEYNTNRYTISNTFQKRGNDVTVTSTITSPVRGYETISGSYEHSGTAESFTGKGELTVGSGTKKTFTISFNSDPKIKLDFELDGINFACCQFIGLNNIKGGFTHTSRSWRNFNAEGFIVIDDQRYTSNVEFKWYGKTFRLTTQAANPQQDYGLTIRHKGGLNDFTSTIILDVGQGEITAKANFKNQRDKKEGKIEVTSPYKGYKKTSLSFSHIGQITDFTSELNFENQIPKIPGVKLTLTHKGSLTDFTSRLSTEYNGKTIAASMVFKKTSQKVDGSITVTTPYANFDKFAAAFSYEASRIRYFVSASVETPYNNFKKTAVEASYSYAITNGMISQLKVETGFQGYEMWNAEVKYVPQGNGIRASAAVNTPIEGYSKFEASVSYAGNPSKFKAGASLQTSIRKFDKFSIEIDHEANNGEFSSSVQVDTPFRRFKTMSASASHQGTINQFITKFEVQTSYPGYENWKIELNHNKDERNINSNLSINTPIQRYNSFIAKFVHGQTTDGFKSEFKVETSIQGYEKFSSELEYSKNNRGYTIKGDVDIPIRRWQKFGFELSHKGNLNSFETVLSAKTPNRKYPEVSLSINHRGHLRDFTTTVNLGYGADKNVMTEVSFKTDGALYEGNFKLESPLCPVVQNLEVTAIHDRSGSGNLDVTYNSNKMIDMDYSYTKTTPFKAHVSINHPHPYGIEVKYDQEGQSYTGEISINLEGQRFQFNMDLKNTIQRYNVEKGLTISVQLPSGKYRHFSTEYTGTPNRINHNLEIQWTKKDESKARYEIELSRTGRSAQKNVNGQLKITSPWVNSESTINHVVTGGRKYVTDVTIESGQRIVLRNELQLGLPKFMNKFTMQHPQLRQDLEFSVEGTINYNIIEGKINAKVDQESFDFHGKIDNHRGRRGIEVHVDHPSTNLDMDFVAELKNTEDARTASAEFKWKSTQETQQAIYKLHSEINKLRKELTIELSCPNRELKLTGRKSISDHARGVHRWTLVGSCEKEIKAEFGWNRPERTMDAQIEFDGDKLAIKGNRESVKDKKLEIYHETNGRKVEDVVISVVAARDGTVSGRTYFRPDMIKDLKEYLNGVNLESNGNCFTDCLDVFAVDLEQKANMFSTRSVPVLKRAVNKIAGDQITLIKKTYTKMYKNNDFKVRSAVNHLSRMADWSEGKIQRMAARASEKLAFYRRKVNVKINYWSDKLNRKVNELGNKIVEIREEYGPMLQDINEFMDTIRTKVKRVMYRIKSHPFVQKLKASVKEIENMNLLEPLHNMKNRVKGKIEELKEEYQAYFDVINDIWGNVEKRQEVRKMNKWIKKVRDWINWAYEHYEIDENMDKLSKSLSAISLDAVRVQAMQEIQNRFQYDRNRVKVWDPESGNFEVEFYIPDDPLKDLHLPKLYIKENLLKVMDWVKEHTPKSGINYYDIFYKYKPSSDMSDWVPPFKGHAALAGNQHFMTFDKKFYEFSGECSYLLARDFIDKKFSVVVHYDNTQGETKKSITVHDSYTKIDIVDGKVHVDGEQVELPKITEHTTIQRHGSEIHIDNDHGATITCALHYDRCTVNVTGWYFGKTGGLFGTYDNEPATDFTTSDNRRTNDVDVFANSWVVGSRCSGTNLAREVAVVPGTRRYDLCSKYFIQYDSPMHSCFGQVDPEPFMQMCINDMGSNRNSLETEKDVCKAAAFFVDECKRHGVPLRVPHACVNCIDPEGNEFTEGDTITLEDNKVPQSADVILVIQHSSCNQEVVSKLADITDDLDQALRAEGLKHNRFGIVGYGGPFALPRTHTIGGEVMGDAAGVAQSLGNLEITMDSGSDDHALRALRFAAKYPFRTGVSKSVILIPCDSCVEHKVRYHEIQQLFRDRDIRLHMLMNHIFTLKGGEKGPKTSMLFGSDSDGIFTQKHVKGDLESDKELYNLVKLPKDICAAMVDVTGGSTFSVHHFLDSRRARQKKFVEVMVRVQADRAKPTECQKCECVPGEDGVGVSVCRDCVQRSCLYCGGLYPSLFGTNDESSIEKQVPLKRPEIDRGINEDRNNNRGPRRRQRGNKS